MSRLSDINQLFIDGFNTFCESHLIHLMTFSDNSFLFVLYVRMEKENLLIKSFASLEELIEHLAKIDLRITTLQNYFEEKLENEFRDN